MFRQQRHFTEWDYDYSDFFGLASQSIRCHQSIFMLLK